MYFHTRPVYILTSIHTHIFTYIFTYFKRCILQSTNAFDNVAKITKCFSSKLVLDCHHMLCVHHTTVWNFIIKHILIFVPLNSYCAYISIQIFSKLYTLSPMRWVVPHRNNRDQKSLWTKSVTGYFNHCQPVPLSTLKSRRVYPIWSKFVTSQIFTKLRLLRT